MHAPIGPWAQRLATWVLPPASAEPVVGDLLECSANTREFLTALLAVLPGIAASQIRRRVTPAGVIANALISGFVFLVALGFAKSPFFQEPGAGWRLAAVWLVWAGGSTLALAYGPAQNASRPRAGVVFGTVAATLGLSALLAVPAAGTAIAIGALMGLSILFSAPAWQAPAPGPLSYASLDAHARLFQRQIAWRNVRESLAAAVVVYVNVDRLRGTTGLEMAGHLLLVGAALFVTAYLFGPARARRVPAADAATLKRFHRSEIVRQRKALRAVPFWYLLPFVPGLVVSFATSANASPVASAGAAVVIGGIFWFVWRLNVLAVSVLDKQIADLDALESIPAQ